MIKSVYIAALAQWQSECFVNTRSSVRSRQAAQEEMPNAEVPKWTNGAVCKTAGSRLPRFESWPQHQNLKVRFWCVFTIWLKLILSEILEN